MKITHFLLFFIKEIKDMFLFIVRCDEMKYGYARCSTNELKQDVAYQRRELLNKGVLEENIFFEYESRHKRG